MNSLAAILNGLDVQTSDFTNHLNSSLESRYIDLEAINTATVFFFVATTHVTHSNRQSKCEQVCFVWWLLSAFRRKIDDARPLIVI